MDNDYTQSDHEVREDDAYALSKYRITLSWLAQFPMANGGAIVNIGAGSGHFSTLATALGYNVTTVEHDSTAIKLAEARLVEGSIINSGLFEFEPTQPMDAIVMHDVLEHIDDDQGAVDRLHTLLSRNENHGVFIGSVPAWPWLYGYHDQQLGHFRRYTPNSLRELFTRRFEILQLRQLGTLGIPAALWYSKFRKRPYPVGAGGLAEKIFAASCRLEERYPTRLGSSVLIAAKPR